MTSRWLKWQPSGDIETPPPPESTDKTDKNPSVESFVSFVSTFAHVQETISATIMRIEQAGGSVCVADGRLVIVPPTETTEEASAAAETLREHETEAVALLEALDEVKRAGVRLPVDEDGRRVAAVPSSADSLDLREALNVLGYSLPVVRTE